MSTTRTPPDRSFDGASDASIVARHERAFLALADHFLDGDERHFLPTTALTCVESGLDVPALHRLYFGEVVPTVGANLLSVAGAWGAWNRDELLARLRARGFDGTPRAPGLGGRIGGWFVPGARATFDSLARFVTLLATLPVESRVAFAEALSFEAGAYFDWVPRDPSELSVAARDALATDLRERFVHAIAPVVSRFERTACERRLGCAFAQLANREANGVDLAPLLSDRGSWTRRLDLPFALPESIVDAIVNAYVTFARPRRAYHDLSHVVEMLRTIRTIGGFESLEAVVLSTLFHDAIYDAASDDSEARSAALLERSVARTTLARWSDRARELVLYTARHGKLERRELDRDAARFLDCDLAVLASAPRRYDAYESAIAAEYGHLPRRVFREGRSRFLARLLAKPRIYFSDDLHEAWDGAARANLRRALDALR